MNQDEMEKLEKCLDAFVAFEFAWRQAGFNASTVIVAGSYPHPLMSAAGSVTREVLFGEVDRNIRDRLKRRLDELYAIAYRELHKK